MAAGRSLILQHEGHLPGMRHLVAEQAFWLLAQSEAARTIRSGYDTEQIHETTCMTTSLLIVAETPRTSPMRVDMMI
jgi:hypothetical protein